MSQVVVTSKIIQIGAEKQRQLHIIQDELKLALRDYTTMIALRRTEPENAFAKEEVERLDAHITSLSEAQKVILREFRKKCTDALTAEPPEPIITAANDISSSKEKENESYIDPKIINMPIKIETDKDMGNVIKKEPSEGQENDGKSVPSVAPLGERAKHVDNMLPTIDCTNLKRRSVSPAGNIKGDREIDTIGKVKFLRLFELIPVKDLPQVLRTKERTRATRQKRSTANHSQFVYDDSWVEDDKKKRRREKPAPIHMKTTKPETENAGSTSRLCGRKPPLARQLLIKPVNESTPRIELKGNETSVQNRTIPLAHEHEIKLVKKSDFQRNTRTDGQETFSRNQMPLTRPRLIKLVTKIQCTPTVCPLDTVEPCTRKREVPPIRPQLVKLVKRSDTKLETCTLSGNATSARKRDVTPPRPQLVKLVQKGDIKLKASGLRGSEMSSRKQEVALTRPQIVKLVQKVDTRLETCTLSGNETSTRKQDTQSPRSRVIRTISRDPCKPRLYALDGNLKFGMPILSDSTLEPPNKKICVSTPANYTITQAASRNTDIVHEVEPRIIKEAAAPPKTKKVDAETRRKRGSQKSPIDFSLIPPSKSPPQLLWNTSGGTSQKPASSDIALNIKTLIQASHVPPGYALKIPGLPSSLTIERISEQERVCCMCRKPALMTGLFGDSEEKISDALTSCNECAMSYHLSCTRSTSTSNEFHICPHCFTKQPTPHTPELEITATDNQPSSAKLAQRALILEKIRLATEKEALDQHLMKLGTDVTCTFTRGGKTD